MIWLYRLLFLPLLLIATPYYLWRMRRRGGYAENFSHRFGGTDPLPAKAPGVRRIWLQAVSVGEMLAIAPLLEAFRREGKTEVYLTTTTSTGYRLAKEKYAALTIGIGYFPIDFCLFSARAWRSVAPDLCILMEGERWPEHVQQANRRGVPVISVNARLSDRSYRRSMQFRWAVAPLAGGIAQVLCASKRDEQRFRALGFTAAQLQTTGNLKLDVEFPLLSDEAKAQWRRDLGLGAGLVLLGSSTWPGEEVALLNALTAARERGLTVSLLLVPRHAERREELRGLLEKSGLSYHFRSSGPCLAKGASGDPVGPALGQALASSLAGASEWLAQGRALQKTPFSAGAVDVAVGDTTGELRQFTQLADLVFVGKSLAPHEGGQTPVEAAVLEKPIIHGPRMTNFREIIHTLTGAGAVRKVETHSELVTAAVELLQDDAQRAKLAAAAKAWHEMNRGATERTLAVIREYLVYGK